MPMNLPSKKRFGARIIRVCWILNAELIRMMCCGAIPVSGMRGGRCWMDSFVERTEGDGLKEE